MSVIPAVVVVLLALVTAAVAQRRNQSGVAWFVIGLLLPLVSLVVVAVLGGGTTSTDPRQLTPARAARRNPVARALERLPASSAHQLADATGSSTRSVAADLRALRNLGLAAPDDTGRWSLTDSGAEAVRGRDDAHVDERR